MKMTVESVFKESEVLCAEAARQPEARRTGAHLALYAAAGSAIYGATMGLYNSPLQALVSAVKVPALFLVTLAICLPTLHFIGLLFGSTIRFGQALVVLLAGIAMTAILLAAFAPISLLFLVSGSDYPFLLLMHVAVFAFCGAAGLYNVQRNFVLLRNQDEARPAPAASAHVLKVWMLLYMFVGTQTAYVLSPFVNPTGAFTLFHDGRGNFYSYLWSVVRELLTR
jgi:hypothetical protein